MNWLPRLKNGTVLPETLDQWFDHVCSDVYADSGINQHLPYLKSLVRLGDVIVELGVGGGDQSTVAWLAGRPDTYYGYDVNRPDSLETLNQLGVDNKIQMLFCQGSTAESKPIECDILMVDSLHEADTVEIELRRFAPLCRRTIVFHDVVTFGRVGQFVGPNKGINLAIAEFMFTHPEWRVADYRTNDNGLLTLTREAK